MKSSETYTVLDCRCVIRYAIELRPDRVRDGRLEVDASITILDHGNDTCLEDHPRIAI